MSGPGCDDRCLVRLADGSEECVHDIVRVYPDGIDCELMADLLGISGERVGQLLRTAAVRFERRAKVARLRAEDAEMFTAAGRVA